jgi:long-chain acyl-CoA synthetase
MERKSIKSAIHRSSLFDAFALSAQSNSDRMALIGDGGRGLKWTYRQLLSEVERVARALIADQRVTSSRPEIGILSENRPEWGAAYLAIMAAGGTAVPIDINLSESEAAYIVGHAHLKTIFVSNRGKALLGEHVKHLNLISFDDGSFGDFQGDANLKPVDSDHCAVLIYTSGTTGAPKAVELTHRNLIANYDGIKEALRFGPDEVFLSVLPLHHTFEATCGFITPILTGCAVAYARSLKSKEIIEDIKVNRATVMCGVPLLYEKIAHAIQRGVNAAPTHRKLLARSLHGLSSVGWKFGLKLGRPLLKSLRIKAGLGSFRLFVSGGAPLPPEIAAFFNYLGIDFLQGYGLTECSPVVSANRPERIVIGSVGPPLRNLDVRIDSPDDTGVGEILVRGDSITRGYRDNEEETALLLRDGWLYTGDLGKLDEGELWITGRAKNLIVSAAGKNIYPEEIEEKVIAQSNLVGEVVVFGRRRDDRQGEDVRAIIVPDMEQCQVDLNTNPDNPNIDEIRAAIGEVVDATNRAMAGYKRIVEYEVQLEELEKTSTKKVKRFLYT